MAKNTKNYDFFDKIDKNSQKDIQRMQELIALIEKYNYHYYTLDNPLVSDKEYDKIYDELVELEKKTNTVLSNSPTQRVGGDILSGFKKHKHEHRLYSLSKVRSFSELEKWAEDMQSFKKTDFALEYKFDGLQLVLEYENGKYKRATTRGNGLIGEDVTLQVKTISSVPLEIDYKEKLIVQGEGMMTKKALEIYNRTATVPLKNARNGVAGAIRNLDPKETAKRRLDFFCYSIIYCEKDFKTQNDMHEFLKKNGFNTGNFFKICKNTQEIIENIKKIDEIKSDLDIDIDGMVIKINEVSSREEIGYTNKFPKWAMAYKFEAMEVSTTLNDVLWQVGRTGKVTPIAVLEPVELAGATISRATLNNTDDIRRKDLAINARVLIRRSNEVIPEVLGVLEKNENCKEIIPPKNCPCCNASLISKNMLLFCPNRDGCPEQIIDRLVHFASRSAMNIEGFSDKTAELFYEKLDLRWPSDLYTYSHEDFLKLEKFKEKKSKNLENSIKNSKNPEFSRFLYALGISEIGDKTAKDLAKNFKNLNELKNASLEDLIAINDVGEIMAKNVFEFFRDEINLREIERLFSLGVKIEYQDLVVSDKFKGKKFVITGTLSKPRQYFVDLIEKHGGNVSGSVSKNTDYVISGDNAGSKLEKALKLNVAVISENEFLNMID